MFNQQKEDDKIGYYASELSRQTDKNVLQKSNLVLQKKLKSNQDGSGQFSCQHQHHS